MCGGVCEFLSRTVEAIVAINSSAFEEDRSSAAAKSIATTRVPFRIGMT
jgi:hypothetical protein